MLYVCETLSLSLREERRLRIFEDSEGLGVDWNDNVGMDLK